MRYLTAEVELSHASFSASAQSRFDCSLCSSHVLSCGAGRLLPGANSVAAARLEIESLDWCPRLGLVKFSPCLSHCHLCPGV